MRLSPINVFQRLAQQWDAIHPYNAAQILRIEGSADLCTLQNTWHDALNDLGLGRVHVDNGHLRYECLNGEMSLYGVRPVAAGISLEEHISTELNHPFSNPAEPPFRPFVLDNGDGSYYVGVVYHHWVADSVSIRTVLREWFVRVHDPKRASRVPARLASTGYRRFFNLLRTGAATGHGFLTATRWASDLRRVRRVEEREDHGVRFAIRAMPKGWLDPVLAAARSHGATLNDVFMAGIAQVCDRFVPLKHRPRRHSLALGSIVDLRPYYGDGLADAFGLFLGFTNVVCSPRDLGDITRLVRSIAQQNRQQKRLGVPQASALRMLAGVMAGRLMSSDKMLRFYQKHVPLAGGISNVNMNHSWATEYHPRPLLDYVRVSPTGPMMPLVFATTTLGKSFHFALTYRPSVVDPSQLDAVAKTFVESVSSLSPSVARASRP